ncbi:MAG: glycosyltransferase [Elusimicrobia bacterium]|nr:glycosyltransferase [Elusimicrobiota bacterium]
MKVLVATVTAGAGHVQAARALEEAWRRLRPDDSVENIDVLKYTPELYEKLYSRGYVKFVDTAPDLYALAFRKTDDPEKVRRFSPLRRLAGRLTAAPFVDKVRELDPDLILATHFMPPEILGRSKEKGRLRAPIVSVVTDFEAHALWLEDSVDLYCVAFPHTRDMLVSRGVAKDAVEVTGIPVAAKFAKPPSKAEAKIRLGLASKPPVLLVLGGGFGMGPLERIAAALDRVSKPLSAVVVCGKNEELRGVVAARRFKHPTTVLGFADNMHELMAACDLVVTKPGGLTSSEALAVGRPLLIVNPLPGQEEANSEFLLERGAAAGPVRLEDIPAELDRLLGSKKLDAMAATARALGRPDAAKRVCEFALGFF